ncbi:MAG TPA: MmcQ/YjbR family DNA-binding protein [Thermoanaerobaculia bacterium]|nr:MmcQ/YjbR family DNA-binding protein [Thermoanaerobaculia bacterium]
MPTRKRKARQADLKELSKALRRFALGLPGATEHSPWGERVVKVAGKVFVFLGADPLPDGEMGLSVKLPESGRETLELPFTNPTGYGLGKAGWVSASFSAKDAPPLAMLEDWILESYRAVAPKRILAKLVDRAPA